MKDLLVIICCNYFTMPPRYWNLQQREKDWRALIDDCLIEQKPMFVMPTPNAYFIKEKFIGSHLDDGGFIKKSDFNKVYQADLGDKKIYYTLIDAIVL